MTNIPQKINEGHKKARLVIFDLDGTLTASKTDMDEEMAGLLKGLLQKKQVAVIGGGAYEQFQKQFLAKLDAPAESLKNLFLFPTTATSFYHYVETGWQEVYVEKLTDEEKKRIFEAFEKTFKELDYHHPNKIYGELIEDRGTQVTFSALGQKAPLPEKEKWKKENADLKLKMVGILQNYLPNMEVRAAGHTSIDVTRKGIDKEYGIAQIKQHLGISFDEMLFVGDALFEGGNDYPALSTGVPCFEVSGPEDTKKIIGSLLE
ncbi:MAG: hypothetical protein A2831_02140 [Candidatus Yanofskybacteria bacterium RIFCSPHIGHO2_01_FULL_44_17]|uniref:phosphomannomutase n=1 Tax=Candidatus Yanofskybacteria bacterium RIFCSPHIGHO2_01_FULL_44_17 TaxID=1802668 RepID=A0A1F8ES09_9BACT|nr:MAG: hypothetical protein A2831_02140 [Candidatus Yanofskybacteria bacterium RIFCSPHIGHO2_01_FULL_44_17]